MALKTVMITVDCVDPDELAQWWARALGGSVDPVVTGQFVTVTHAAGPRLSFQKVDEPTPGKNRIHLDFHTADMEAEVTRLIGLGAQETGRHSFGEEFRWVVLADPAGNAFCVAEGG